MKHLFLLFALFISTMPMSHAQLTLSSPDTFRIQRSPLRYWHGGEKLRKPAQIQSVLLTKNDLQINREWQQAKTTRSIGTGVMVLGVVLEAVGLSQTVKGATNGTSGGTGLVVGGAGLMLVGGIIGALSKSPTKRAILRYNDLQMGRSAPSIAVPHDIIDQDDTEPANPGDAESDTEFQHNKSITPDPSGPRIGVHIGVNSSKFWEIGGSEEFHSDEKIWWAKSTPIVFSYELPATVPGQSLSLELAIIGKGNRSKSENTNGSGTTKSKNDFQLTFAQLAGLKKFPLGPQDRDLRFHAQGGLFIAYAVNARSQSRSRLKDDDTRRRTRQISKFDFGDESGEVDFNRLDVGLMIGGGASYPFKYGRLLFDARFSVGALNLWKAEGNNPDLKFPSLHSRDLTIMVGYSVPLSMLVK